MSRSKKRTNGSDLKCLNQEVLTFVVGLRILLSRYFDLGESFPLAESLPRDATRKQLLSGHQGGRSSEKRRLKAF